MNRKLTLHILLVLTFIFAGLSCFSYLVTAAILPTMQQYYAAHSGLFPEQLYVAMTTFLELPRSYFLAAGLLYGLEVVGAALMWNLRSSGFHCYTLARLLLILVPLLFLGKAYLALGDVMMAALFILVYWLLLRELGAFSHKEEEDIS